MVNTVIYNHFPCRNAAETTTHQVLSPRLTVGVCLVTEKSMSADHLSCNQTWQRRWNIFSILKKHRSIDKLRHTVYISYWPKCVNKREYHWQSTCYDFSMYIYHVQLLVVYVIFLEGTKPISQLLPSVFHRLLCSPRTPPRPWTPSSGISPCNSLSQRWRMPCWAQESCTNIARLQDWDTYDVGKCRKASGVQKGLCNILQWCAMCLAAINTSPE